MEGKRGSSPQHLETSALTSLASLWVLAKPPSSPAHSGSGMERRGRPAPLFTLIRRRQEGEGAIFSFRTPRWGAQVQSGRGAGCTWAANPGSHPDWRRNTIDPSLSPWWMHHNRTGQLWRPVCALPAHRLHIALLRGTSLCLLRLSYLLYSGLRQRCSREIC